MPRLSCTVKNCYYNKSSKCCREEIDVHGHEATMTDATYCSSFKEKLDGTTAKNEHTDNAPENALDVKCEAVRCVFNDNSKCHADRITIEGNGAKHESQTECGSFRCSNK